MTKLVRILIVLAAALTVVAAPPADAAEQQRARATFSWGGPQLVLPRVGEITGAACVDDTRCWATLDSGHVVRMRDGHATSLQQVSRHRLAAVSCASTTCVAVGDGGEAVTRSGRRWTSHTIDGGRDLTSVSCAAARSCVAGDTSGRVVRWDGTRWSAERVAPRGTGIAEVTCGSRTLCWVLDSAGNLYRSRAAGWSDALALNGDTGIEHVSCASARFCMATSFVDGAWTFDGQHWTQQQDANVREGHLACGSRRLCVSTDTSPFEVATLYDGAGWQWADYVPYDRVGEVAAACGPTTCLVLDVTHARRYDGTGWSYERVVSPHGGALSASCATAEFCAITDDKSASTWNGRRWSGARILADDPTPDTGFQGRVSTTGLSCPAAHSCVTTLVDREFLIDGAFPSAQRWNGRTWKDMDFPGDAAAVTDDLACGAPGSCVATGQQLQEGTPNDEAYWYQLGAGGWSRTLNGAETDIGDIDCPSADVCVFTVQKNGRGWVGTGDTSGFDGLQRVAAQPLGFVSCWSTTSCLAITDHKRSVQLDGTTWSPRPRTGLPGSATGLSCTGATFCQAVDDQGYAVGWDGARWSSPQRLVRGTVTDVSCASRAFCVAAADGGRVVVGRR